MLQNHVNHLSSHLNNFINYYHDRHLETRFALKSHVKKFAIHLSQAIPPYSASPRPYHQLSTYLFVRHHY